MHDFLIDMMSINYVNLFFVVVVVVVGTVFVKEAFEKFCNAFGIEFSFIREKKEFQECQIYVKNEIKNLSERQQELDEIQKNDYENNKKFQENTIEAIESIKGDIKSLSEDLDRREAKKRVQKLRYYLASFANRLENSEHVTHDLASEINDNIREYHDLVEKYNFENGKVETSIKIINRRFNKMVDEGNVIMTEEGDDVK